MTRNKKVTVVICSCVNCPRSHWNDEIRTLWCNELNRYIEPSSQEPGAIYFHKIPDDCPFPDTDEKVT